MQLTKTLLIAGLATAALGATQASAATLSGSTLNPAANTCDAQKVYVESDSLPTGGVITQWKLNRPAGTSGQVALKLVGVNDFFDTSHIYGSSALESVSAVGQTTMYTRMQASSDEHVGLWHATGQKCTITSGIGATEGIFKGSDAIANPPGNGQPFALDGAPTEITNTRLVVQVQIENDADGDIFGDDTQDNCLGVYGAINGCPAVYTPPPPPPPICTVPNVKGLAKKAATSAIFAAGCKQSKAKTKKLKKFTKKKKKGIVASQTVKAGSVLPFGSAVGITVYAKKKK